MGLDFPCVHFGRFGHLFEKTKIGFGSPGPSQWILDDFYYDCSNQKSCFLVSTVNKSRFLTVFHCFLTPNSEQPLLHRNRATQQALPCRPQHFPGGQKCFLGGKMCIRATRQVLWPAWQHCSVVRFSLSTDDEGLWVQKNN